MAKVGRDFEHAVHAFVARLVPGAKVLFDHRVPDKDTGSPRQVDVWVEGLISAHIPITVHISCKDYARKINVTQIGTFINEVQSTGASMGIIYSRKGFPKDAVRKAKAHGLSCCRLYQKANVDVPGLVWIWNYLCIPDYNLQPPPPEERGAMSTWRDVMTTTVEVNPKRALADILDGHFKELEAVAAQAEAAAGAHFPRPAGVSIRVEPVEGGAPFTLGLLVTFRYFRGRMEAYEVNGSYCVSNGSFSGSLAGPAVDLRGDTPGPGWEQFAAVPEVRGKLVVMTLGGGSSHMQVPAEWWQYALAAPAPRT